MPTAAYFESMMSQAAAKNSSTRRAGLRSAVISMPTSMIAESLDAMRCRLITFSENCSDNFRT